MKNYRQFQPLVISEFGATEWPHPLHRHNHHELIFIVEGKGVHELNSNQITYIAGDIFLVAPDDAHRFEISELTKFIFIKFTDFYLNRSFGLNHLEYLVKSRETHLAGFRLNEADQQTAGQIFQVVLSLKQDMLINEELIWLQILSLAALLQRNMPELKVAAGRSRDMQAMFCYLHKHIYTPEKLKATVLAEAFHTTADYIGPYFKRNAGVTLRDYIAAYRKKLVQQRLDSGNYSHKQIAAEFGLTDDSHVRKLLR